MTEFRIRLTGVSARDDAPVRRVRKLAEDPRRSLSLAASGMAENTDGGGRHGARAALRRHHLLANAVLERLASARCVRPLLLSSLRTRGGQ
jgi:hypothetical protein